MRNIRIAMVLLLGLCCVLFTAAAKPAPKTAPKTPPVAAASFKPGASVILEITLKSPENWKLNHLAPMRFSLDKDQLKKGAISASKSSWDFKLKDYAKSYTATIPITLGKGVKEGKLSVPIDIACSICDDPGDQCTFANEKMTVSIVVKAANGGDPAQAVAKGTCKTSYRLSTP
jgi:hypothetical protein